MVSLSAAEMLHLKETLERRRPGCGLPRDLYHDELVYRAEMDFIWRQGWLLAGHSCQIAEQDWAICVNQQRGVNSRAFTPGPLSMYKEYNLDRFLRWYLMQMKAAIG
jgi:phenylpropionate dioxygenase-like ring-hydroxylating dioxygenase large terminal subunit